MSVFDEYIKIAEELGMVNGDIYHAPDQDIIKNKIAKEREVDEKIALLYGVKPKGSFDEKEHAVDVAHPHTSVVFPAEDKMNGIVENELQRQDIMHQIATRPTNGKYQQKLFVTAHNDLLNTILKAGNELDCHNNTELSVFADKCAENLVKSAVAPAVAPFVWGPVLKGGAIAIAAIVGGIAAINNTKPVVQSVVTNAKVAIDELKKFNKKAKSSNINYIITVIEKLSLYSKKFAERPATRGLTKEELLKLKDSNGDDLKFANGYKNVLEYMNEEIPGYISELKVTDIVDTGDDDWLAKIKGVFNLISANEKDSAIMSLEALKESVLHAKNGVEYYLTNSMEYVPTIENIFESAGVKLDSDPKKDSKLEELPEGLFHV